MTHDARRPQRAIYALLKRRGVDVRTEYRLPATDARSRSGFFFADVAVFRNGHPVALCECKKTTRELRAGTRQRTNYDGSRIPYIVAGNDNIAEAVLWLAKRAQ